MCKYVRTSWVATVVWLFVLFGAGCASSSKFDNLTAEQVPDHVIARIDDLTDRPEWLSESEPFSIDENKIISLGSTEIPGDHRLDAGYRIAESNAEAAVAGAIEKKLEFIFQNSEEGTEMGDTQVRYIGAEASRLLASSIRPGKRYWEKIAYSTDAGLRRTKYRIFASVEMPEPEFKRAIVNALRRSEGRVGLSADFAKKVDEQWDRFAAPKEPNEKSE